MKRRPGLRVKNERAADDRRDVMMNYCFVRPGRGSRPVDPEQTHRKEVVPTALQEMTQSLPGMPTDNILPRRSYSESAAEAASEVFIDDEEGVFDFYLAVAEKDLVHFGIPFRDMVQERMNLKPCLTIPHIPIGSHKYETMAEYLETRCGGKVVFVVSRDFAKSDECQFLVHFAKTLDPAGSRQRLIPLIIDKNVELPRVLEGVTPINYNAAMREKLLGHLLWEAINGDHRYTRSFSSPAP